METLTLLLLVTMQRNKGNTGPPTVGYHATQQYRSGERIHGTIAATVT
jgi:hypothetical protein